MEGNQVEATGGICHVHVYSEVFSRNPYSRLVRATMVPVVLS